MDNLRDKIANEISKGAPIKNVFETADAIMELPEIAQAQDRIVELEGAIAEWNTARLAASIFIRGTENKLYDAGMNLVSTLEAKT
jgi:citrate lyase beta subunit